MPDLYVDGAWVTARAGGRREIRCPADGSLVGRGGRGRPGGHRGRHRGGPPRLPRGPLAEHPGPRARRPAAAASPTCSSGTRDEVAEVESLDTGKRLVESEYDVADVVSRLPPLRAGRRRGRRPGGRHRQPRRGQPGRARAGRRLRADHAVELPAAPGRRGRSRPCLAAGNTFVLKPSELTPHTAIHLMRLLEEAGLPAGVGNLVLGAGPEAGAPLSEDPRVDLVSFTGGLETGRRIMAAAAGHGEEGRAGARRQEPQHRLRRRRPRGRPRLRPDRGLPALRPGLLGRRPAGGRGVDPRRVRRRAGRAGRPDPARRAVRREGRDRRR